MTDTTPEAGELIGLAVWCVSIADHEAEHLTPRQIEKLYAAGDKLRALSARTPSAGAGEDEDATVKRLMLDFLMLKLPEDYREQIKGNIDRNEYAGTPLYDFGRFVIATLREGASSHE